MHFQVDDNQPFFLQAIDYQFARAEEDLNSVTDNEWVKAPLGFSMGVAQSLIHLPVSLFQFAKHFISEFPREVEQALRQNRYNPFALVGAPLVVAGKLLFYEPMVGLVEQLRGIRNGVEQTGEMNWQQAGAFAFGASLLAKGATDATMGMLNTIENIGTGLANSVRNSGPPPLATTGTLVTGGAAVTNAVWGEILPPPIIQRSVDDETKGGEVDPVFLLRALDRALADGKIKTALELLGQMIEIGGQTVLNKLREVAETYLLPPIKDGGLDPVTPFSSSQLGLRALQGLALHKSPCALELARQMARGEKLIFYFVLDRAETSRSGRAINQKFRYAATFLEPTHPYVTQTILSVLEGGEYGEAGITLLREVFERIEYKLEEVRMADVEIVDGPMLQFVGPPVTLMLAEKAFSFVTKSGEGGLFLRLVEANSELANLAFQNASGKVFKFSAEDAPLLLGWLFHSPKWLGPHWLEVHALALRQTDICNIRYQAAKNIILKEDGWAVREVLSDRELYQIFLKVLNDHVGGVETIVEDVIEAQPRLAKVYYEIENESVRQGVWGGLRKKVDDVNAMAALVYLGQKDVSAVEILIEGYRRFPQLRDRLASALEQTGREEAAAFFEIEKGQLSRSRWLLRKDLARRAARIRAGR